MVLLLAAAPASKRRCVNAAAVLPGLAAVPPHILAGAPTATVVEVADPVDQQTVLTRVRSAAAAPGPLTLYLAGQLERDRKQGLLHLALAHTTPSTVRYTGLPWHWLAAELAGRPAGTTTVVADLVAADEGSWKSATGDALGLGPGVRLYGRVAPPPPRRTVVDPDYLHAWTEVWRTGAHPGPAELHAHAAAFAGDGALLLPTDPTTEPGESSAFPASPAPSVPSSASAPPESSVPFASPASSEPSAYPAFSASPASPAPPVSSAPFASPASSAPAGPGPLYPDPTDPTATPAEPSEFSASSAPSGPSPMSPPPADPGAAPPAPASPAPATSSAPGAVPLESMPPGFVLSDPARPATAPPGGTVPPEPGAPGAVPPDAVPPGSGVPPAPGSAVPEPSPSDAGVGEAEAPEPSAPPAPDALPHGALPHGAVPPGEASVDEPPGEWGPPGAGPSGPAASGRAAAASRAPGPAPVEPREPAGSGAEPPGPEAGSRSAEPGSESPGPAEARPEPAEPGSTHGESAPGPAADEPVGSAPPAPAEPGSAPAPPAPDPVEQEPAPSPADRLEPGPAQPPLPPLPPVPSVPPPPAAPPAPVEQTSAGTGTGMSAGPGTDTAAGGGPRSGAVEDPLPAVLEAARAGRHAEAAAMAAVWEAEALRHHGPTSASALRWLEVRADLARLAGASDRSCELWMTVAETRLRRQQAPDDPEVEGAVDRAHHQWEHLSDPERARTLAPALIALRRRVPGRQRGALAALQRRLEHLHTV